MSTQTAKKKSPRMAQETATAPTQPQDGGLPATPGKLPGTPRRRRPNMARPGNANQWTPEQAREMGKKGGRPKGSITKAYRTVYVNRPGFPGDRVS